MSREGGNVNGLSPGLGQSDFKRFGRQGTSRAEEKLKRDSSSGRTKKPIEKVFQVRGRYD